MSEQRVNIFLYFQDSGISPELDIFLQLVINTIPVTE